MNKIPLKKKKIDLNKEMAHILLKPTIKEEAVPHFVQLINTKINGSPTSHRLFQEAVLKSISELFDDPQKHFDYGLFYGKDEISYFKMHLVDIMTLNIHLIPGGSGLNQEEEEVKTRRPRKKTVIIPKIRTAFQNECIPIFNIKLKEATKKYKIDKNLEDDVVLNETQQSEVVWLARQELYAYLKIHNKDAIKNTAKTKPSKPDPIIKEFINKNYVISDKSSTLSCDIHKHYQQWMTINYPNEIQKKITVFGKILRSTELGGKNMQKHSNRQKQGWCIVRV